MNTKKFDISFSHAHYLSANHEIEMSALVMTDNAHHYCRLRMEGPTDSVRRVWVDGHRSYTPEQEAHVTQLFQYRLPSVRVAIQAYLTEHSFGEIYVDKNINMHLDENLQIKSLRYEKH